MSRALASRLVYFVVGASLWFAFGYGVGHRRGRAAQQAQQRIEISIDADTGKVREVSNYGGTVLVTNMHYNVKGPPAVDKAQDQPAKGSFIQGSPLPPPEPDKAKEMAWHTYTAGFADGYREAIVSHEQMLSFANATNRLEADRAAYLNRVGW